MQTDIENPETIFGCIEKAVRHFVPAWTNFNAVDRWPGHLADVAKVARSHGLTTAREGRMLTLFREDVPCGLFNGLTSSLVSSPAVAAVNSKWFTKRLLARGRGTPVPLGEVFGAEQLDEAWAYVSARSDRKWVVKPVSGKQGKGISVGVATQTAFRVAWKRAAAEGSRVRPEVLVEEFVPGVDLRASVVNGRTVAVAIRIPPFVVGDGRASVRQLFELLTESRRVHAYLRSKDVVVDYAVLNAQGTTWESVPEEGKLVFLNGTANLSSGGISVDVTEVVSSTIAQMAVSAAETFPGLRSAGVDLISPSITTGKDTRIIELNAAPNPVVHEYPAFGQPRDVSGAIIGAFLSA